MPSDAASEPATRCTRSLCVPASRSLIWRGFFGLCESACWSVPSVDRLLGLVGARAQRTNCLFNSTLLPSTRLNESVCILPRGWSAAASRHNTRLPSDSCRTRACWRAGPHTPRLHTHHHHTCLRPRPSLRRWRSSWGRETANNAKNACCEPTLRSLYSIETLAALSSSPSAAEEATRASGRPRHTERRGPTMGPTFVWLDAELVDGAGGAVENLLHSTGGNTLIAAAALCDHVDVYGAGLFSLGPSEDKVYTHYCAPRRRALSVTPRDPWPWLSTSYSFVLTNNPTCMGSYACWLAVLGSRALAPTPPPCVWVCLQTTNSSAVVCSIRRARHRAPERHALSRRALSRRTAKCSRTHGPSNGSSRGWQTS
jgi:hypothetical protein